MQEVLSIDFRSTFPVFPLPDSVLLPNSLMPLHVFEPRYRRMVSDVLDGFGLIAMATFQHDVTADEYFHGMPELRTYVGLGHIRHYEKLHGERYVIVLQGICRARIVSEPELHGYGYRRIRIQPADVGKHDETKLTRVRGRLLSLLEDPRLRRLEPLRDLDASVSRDSTSTSALVDIVSARIANSTATKYRLLSEPSLVRRTGWLIGYLQALRNALTEEA